MKLNKDLEEKIKEECIWKQISKTSPNKERYKLCLECSGYEKKRICYVPRKYFPKHSK